MFPQARLERQAQLQYPPSVSAARQLQARYLNKKIERGTVKRRDLLVGLVSGVGFTAGNAYLWQMAENSSQTRDALAEDGYDLEGDPFALPDGEEGIGLPVTSQPPRIRATVADAVELPSLDALTEERSARSSSLVEAVEQNLAEADLEPCCGNHGHQGAGHDHLADEAVRNRVLEKVRNFNGDFIDDLFLTEKEKPVLHSLFVRLKRAERLVGHGNYNLLSFDELFKYGKRFSEVGVFTPAEFQMIEKLFFTEARKYGFYGEKVTTELTAKIPPQETIKIPYSGHYLLRGESSAYYEKLRRDIGESVILTSGVRGNVKQMHLFVAKCLEANYNLSKASRSLAPPGHSYHGIGDFDVGRVGWGYSNFTDKFAETDEFKRMQDLGYVQIRYTKDNHYGVRFEPWHIKVA